MGRTKEVTPDNICRFTIQMDDAVYNAVKIAAIKVKRKTYELMNKLVLMGIEAWSKEQKDAGLKINIKEAQFSKARDMAKTI